jgi:hypothetical protein
MALRTCLNSPGPNCSLPGRSLDRLFTQFASPSATPTLQLLFTACPISGLKVFIARPSMCQCPARTRNTGLT